MSGASVQVYVYFRTSYQLIHAVWLRNKGYCEKANC